MKDKERKEEGKLEEKDCENIETDADEKNVKKDSFKEEKEADDRSFLDKVEDGMDEVVANVQDFFYGEREDYSHDIPATMPDPDNELRHINKVQTRRNFNKRYGKRIFKWLGIIFVVGLCISLGYMLIEKLLLA